MKQALVFVALLVGGVFLWLLATLSSDARSLAVGVCFGVAPVIVMSLYVLAVQEREERGQYDDYRPPTVYHRPTAQPPQITNNFYGPVQQNYGFPALPPVSGPPAVCQREYEIERARLRRERMCRAVGDLTERDEETGEGYPVVMHGTPGEEW